MNRTYAPRDAAAYRHRNSQRGGPRYNGTPRADWRSEPASDAQISRIERTLTDHDLHAGDFDLLWARLEAHRIDERTPGDGTRIRKGQASQIIDELASRGYEPKRSTETRQAIPGRQAETAARTARRNTTPAAVGLYRRDGRLFVIREFTPQGEDAPVRFARELVPTEGGQADRANADGEAVSLRSIKAPRMQWELRADEAVSLDDAKALGIKFGECLICGRPIETKESVEDRAGMGPVCFERQTALLEAGA